MEVTKVPKKIVTVIEPKRSMTVDKEKYRQKRVAAYCRVSTDSEEQLISYANQKKVYTEMIASRKDWCFAGLFADEGKSGTRADKRPEFNKMINDCLAGKIDYIITKSVSRFARNTVDCLDYVRMLKSKGIGVYFEEQQIDTLKTDSELYLVIYAGFAQSESESICSNIINQLVQLINNDSLMEVKAHLVGSGAKNLITQNSNEPIDLDYNLMIIHSEINSGREIKEYIRKQFNVILNKNGWSDCMDSTSVLTTEKQHFTKGNHTEFSIDLAIVFNDRNGWHRLIHEKTGFTAWDRYYWNLVPDSKDLLDKVTDIKGKHLWNEVIDEYREKKNLYLCRQDYNHPSFNVYVETVNQVFNKYFD